MIRISRWRSRRVRELAKVNIEDRLFKAARENVETDNMLDPDKSVYRGKIGSSGSGTITRLSHMSWGS